MHLYPVKYENIFRVCAGIVLALLLCAAAAGTTFAFNHYELDTAALKELTAQDDFDVTITQKTVTDDINWGNDEGEDILTLSMKNNTTQQEVDQITVLVVCYGEDNRAEKLKSKMGFSLFDPGAKDKRELSVLTFDDLAAAPGADFQVTIPCRHSNFTGVGALVAQYTDGDGNEITNPIVEQWQELALGSPTHILD